MFAYTITPASDAGDHRFGLTCTNSGNDACCSSNDFDTFADVATGLNSKCDSLRNLVGSSQSASTYFWE